MVEPERLDDRNLQLMALADASASQDAVPVEHANRTSGDQEASMRAVRMDDFFPAIPVLLEDFYPEGAERYFLPKRQRTPMPRMGPDAAALLIPLCERLKAASEAELELLTIMEVCHQLLERQGVKFKFLVDAMEEGKE